MNLNELRAKPHLSSSSISDYIDCGMLYKFSRVDMLKRQIVPSSMHFGTVIHLVLAEFYQGKMDGYKMLLKDIHESFKNHWHERAKNRTDIQYADGEENFDTMLNQGIDLITAW